MKIHKTKLNEETNDLAYWLTKTPAERLAALEVLRIRYLKFFKNGTESRLQRVCSIVKQK
ncbi:hypothetical protein BH09BAC5_BH09BAC5_03220 [soil metagenome]